MVNLQPKNAGSSSRVPRPDDPYHPYVDPKYGKQVHCIYFYYLNPTTNKVLAYYHDNYDEAIKETELVGMVTTMAQSAVSVDQPPPPNGSSFKSYKWRRRSYIAIVIDDPTWKFPNKAIQCVEPNVSLYNANHHNKVIVTDATGASRTIPLFYCINHIKKSLYDDDGDLDKREQPIQLQILRDRHPLDPLTADGTNLGPPVGPPLQRLKKSLFAKLGHWLSTLLRF